MKLQSTFLSCSNSMRSIAITATILCFSGSLYSAENFTYDPKLIHSPSHLTTAQADNPLATHAMVTSPHYLATQAGIDVLQRGGSAIDAAIATAATLAVVYPQMCTLGGDSFWLIYDAKSGELKALNASGRAGEKATIDFYKSKGFSKIPSRGYYSANTVPGIVSGWDKAYQYSQQHMNSHFAWKDLFKTPISLAKNGFPVSSSLEYWSKINLDPTDSEFRNLSRFSEFAKIFLKNSKQAYQVGDILKQEDLGNTLQLIADKGAKEFYQGSIAKAIVADLQAHDGMLTLNDFSAHQANWVKPIHVAYRDTIAYNFPPNTQGMASLEILNILNNFDVRKLGEGTADYYHLLIEATKQSFADRDKYLSDPDFVHIPLDKLLSKEHGKEQAKQIDMQKAATNVQALDPKGDTVWFGVVDAQGNAVSLIQSIYHDFGSAIVPKGTGIILQNRGSFFSLDKNNVNALAPHKRTFHTLNPAMLFKNNKPYLIYGTMGGEGQPQTQAALVTRIVDFAMSPQQAVDAPRWLYGRTWGASSNDLKLEGRISAQTAQELQRRGHPVKMLPDYTDTMGHAGAILIRENGVLQGASDPRSDGLATGF
ncbi:gamma-glutamyltranspeptidase [Gallibacterium salpingitidis]|uniref:Glutathione hydrolase proenzyme n=1 Tax=Gallibacterium salpingitidis TaxID=505341 RepID=A0AB36DZT6_9PAST|nr:gamma-glutamyltransferase [Gallibacterium salpingitidis]OBX06819.1 gamma-glutamyltranspeptidase [Gallibacterium salpingitidis]OBX07729.1 gamma-glutamyltranspeptidase [Gallibacterium salpingitidis]WKT00411.1 gamma-glutamyltransferase [Gallibacterium salpingitidis]